MGDAGTAIVWSDQHTDFAGQIVGTGGPNGGNGGYAEISSHNLLSLTGFASLKASAGSNGTLLLDPANVTISTSATSNETFSGGTYSPNSGVATSNILNTDLQTQLGLGNVIRNDDEYRHSGHWQRRHHVSAALTWTNTNTLTLTASRNIAINNTITANSGTLILASNGGTVTQTAAISVANLALTGAGAPYTLNNTNNNIVTLAANTASVSVTDRGGLTVGLRRWRQWSDHHRSRNASRGRYWHNHYCRCRSIH